MIEEENYNINTPPHGLFPHLVCMLGIDNQPAIEFLRAQKAAMDASIDFGGKHFSIEDIRDIIEEEKKWAHAMEKRTLLPKKAAPSICREKKSRKKISKQAFSPKKITKKKSVWTCIIL